MIGRRHWLSIIFWKYHEKYYENLEGGILESLDVFRNAVKL